MSFSILPSHWEYTLKERIYFHRSKFFKSRLTFSEKFYTNVNSEDWDLGSYPSTRYMSG